MKIVHTWLTSILVASMCVGALVSPSWAETADLCSPEEILADPPRCSAPNTLPGPEPLRPCDDPGPDANGYTCAPIPSGFIDISKTAPDCLFPQPIGFDFTYHEATYDAIYIFRDGHATFDDPALDPPFDPFYPLEIPETTYGRPTVAASWMKYMPKPQQCAVLGSAPHRIFVAQWTDMEHQSNATAVANDTFQIQLHETTNVADVHLLDVNTNTAPDTRYTHRSIGAQASGGTVGLQYRFGSFAAKATSMRFTPPPERNAVETSCAVPSDLFGYTCTVMEWDADEAFMTGGNGSPAITMNGLGFEFPYGQHTYTQAWPSRNGLLAFSYPWCGSTSIENNWIWWTSHECLPPPWSGASHHGLDDPGDAIGVYWGRHACCYEVWHSESGTAPNRRHDIWWAEPFNAAGYEWYLFGVRLHESGVIDVFYNQAANDAQEQRHAGLVFDERPTASPAWYGAPAFGATYRTGPFTAQNEWIRYTPPPGIVHER